MAPTPPTPAASGDSFDPVAILAERFRAAIGAAFPQVGGGGSGADPLITASRTKDFEGADRARVQLHTWMLSLQDVPEAVLTEAVARLVRRGVTWMPKPGELKAVCADVLTERRTAVAKRHLEDCPHSGHWTEDAHGRMVRCPCWTRAMDAKREIGHVSIVG